MRRYIRRIFQWVWGRPPPAREVWERRDWASEEQRREWLLAHETRRIAEAYMGRANTHRFHGKTDEAVADTTAAIEVDPAYAEAYRSRGVFVAEQGDYYGGMADFNKAIELEPDRAVGYYTRGMTLLDNGYTDEAIADLRRIIELEPQSELADRARREVPGAGAPPYRPRRTRRGPLAP